LFNHSMNQLRQQFTSMNTSFADATLEWVV